MFFNSNFGQNQINFDYVGDWRDLWFWFYEKIGKVISSLCLIKLVRNLTQIEVIGRALLRYKVNLSPSRLIRRVGQVILKSLSGDPIHLCILLTRWNWNKLKQDKHTMDSGWTFEKFPYIKTVLGVPKNAPNLQCYIYKNIKFDVLKFSIIIYHGLK